MQQAALPFTDHPYGTEHSDQFVRVHLPSSYGPSSKLPVVVIVHGGFWKHKWDVNNAAHTTLAPSLVVGGAYAAVEVEYRRGFEETPNAGFPATQDDVAAALACLPQLAMAHHWPLDFEKLVLLGHSAGGQLALLAADHAAKRRAAALEAVALPPPGEPEDAAAAPAEEPAVLLLEPRVVVVVPRLVVVVAPVADLVAAFHRKLSDEGDAAVRYMRGSTPADEGAWEQWRTASPAHCCLPLRVPTLLVSGLGDRDVPMDLVVRFYDQAVAAAHAANTGAANAITSEQALAAAVGEVHFLECSAGADHYAPVDARSADWARIRAFVDAEVAKWQ